MKQVNIWSYILFTLVYIRVNGQTPPRYSPFSSNQLKVFFPEHGGVRPGEFLPPHVAQHTPILGAESLNIFNRYIAFAMDTEVRHGSLAYPLLHWYQPDLRVGMMAGEFVLHNITDSGAHYVGPQPPPGPDHSYVIMLFLQPADYQFPDCFANIFPISVETRRGFDLHRFMAITGLGRPIAANYFFSGISGRGIKYPTPPSSTYLSHAPCQTQMLARRPQW